MYNPFNYHPERPSEIRTGWKNPTPADEAACNVFLTFATLVGFVLLLTVGAMNPLIGGAIVLAAFVWPIVTCLDNRL